MVYSRRSNRRERAGISDDTTDKDLREVFSKFGDIKSVRIPRDMTTQRHRGYAFITFQDVDAANEATHAPIKVLDRDVHIEIAREGPRERGAPRRPRYHPYPHRYPRDPYYYDPRARGHTPPPRRPPPPHPMDPMMDEMPYEEWDPRDRRTPRDMRVPPRRGGAGGSASSSGGGYPPSSGMSRAPPPEYEMPYVSSMPRGYTRGGGGGGGSGAPPPYMDYPPPYGMEPPARMRYGDYYAPREHDPRRDRDRMDDYYYRDRYDRRARRSYDRRDHKRRDYRRPSDERSMDDHYHHHRGSRRRSEERLLEEGRGSVSPPPHPHHHHHHRHPHDHEYEHEHGHDHDRRRSPEHSPSPPPPPSEETDKDGREYPSMSSDGADNHHEHDGRHDIDSLEHHAGNNY